MWSVKYYRPRDPEKRYENVIELKLKNDAKVYVIGIEDIILDRMRACIHLKSSSDCEWGKRMYLLHFDRLNHEYMMKTAKIDLTADLLEKWKDEN